MGKFINLILKSVTVKSIIVKQKILTRSKHCHSRPLGYPWACPSCLLFNLQSVCSEGRREDVKGEERRREERRGFGDMRGGLCIIGLFVQIMFQETEADKLSSTK